MDTLMKPVQIGRGRRRWSSAHKLGVLQEWKTGILLEEICPKYAVNAAWMYSWKRSLAQRHRIPSFQRSRFRGEVILFCVEASDVKRVKELEHQNSRLKWVVLL